MTMIENGVAKRRRPSLRLLVLWSVSIVVGAEVFAFTTGLSIAFLNASSTAVLLLFWAFGAIGGLIAGLIAGVIQRLLLPGGVPWSRFWVRATLLGWTLGGSIYWLLGGAAFLAFEVYPREGLSPALGITLQAGLVVIAGVIIGLVQELFLQRSPGPRSRAWVWLRVSAIGWAAGSAAWAGLTYLGAELGGMDYEVFRYLLLPLSGGVAGIITAVAMDKLIVARQGGGENVETALPPGTS